MRSTAKFRPFKRGQEPICGYNSSGEDSVKQTNIFGKIEDLQ